MLVEFRVKNYRCFRAEQVLSLVAGADASLPANLIDPGPAAPAGLKLLRSVVIYGPNASGKTKLLDAMHVVSELIDFDPTQGRRREFDVEPFLLDPAMRDQPSEFEFTFIQEGVRYQYGFAIDRKQVHREYLYGAPRGRNALYFMRELKSGAEADGYRYKFGASLKGPNDVIRRVTTPTALFLGVAAVLNHPTLTAPYNWFAEKFAGLQAQFFLARGNRLNEDFHEQVKGLLALADTGVCDYQLTEIQEPAAREAGTGPAPEEAEGAARGTRIELRPVKIEMLHRGAGGELVALDLGVQSHGTLSLFSAAVPLLEALAEGRTLFVDELDASKHPLIVRFLVEMFHNPELNQRGAQLIFNTHDTSLLDQNLFRRDQVWFTEKDADGAAHLYSLLDYSPRKGEALAKGYLLGRYGAIPFVGDPSTLLAGAPRQDACADADA